MCNPKVVLLIGSIRNYVQSGIDQNERIEFRSIASTLNLTPGQQFHFRFCRRSRSTGSRCGHTRWSRPTSWARSREWRSVIPSCLRSRRPRNLSSPTAPIRGKKTIELISKRGSKTVPSKLLKTMPEKGSFCCNHRHPKVRLDFVVTFETLA